MGMLKPLLTPLLAMIPPTFDLDLTAATVDQRVTFTRASTKTYFDSAGIMRTAAVNEWPREYDPATVTRVNYLRGARSLDGYLPTNTAITKGYSVAPDGRADGILVSSVNTGGTGGISFALVLTPPTNTPLWCWAMLRAGTVRYIRIRPLNLNSAPFVEIDLLNGVAVGSSMPPHFIEPMGDGVYKFGVLYEGGDDTSGAFSIQVLSAPNALYNGPLDGTQNFEFFGAQAEPSATPTELIETGANPAGDAVCVGRSVWEARTNLLPYSATMNAGLWVSTNVSLTANAATAPDGATTMNLLAVTTGGGRLRYGAMTVVAGQAYALTFRLKKAVSDFAYINFGTANGLGGDSARAWFNLATGVVSSSGTLGSGWALNSATIRSIGRGIYECTIVVTPGATTAYAVVAPAASDGAGSGAGESCYVWGAQLEAASFASPYIPTTTAAVTRSAEEAYVDNPSGFGYNPNESTVLVDYTHPAGLNPTTYGRQGGLLFRFYTPGLAEFTNQVVVGPSSSRLYAAFRDISSSGFDAGNFTAGILNPFTPAYGQPTKAAMSWKAGVGGSICSNGSDPLVFAPHPTLPATNWTRLHLTRAYDASVFCGWKRRVAYWPVRLSDAEIEGMVR